MGDRPTSTTRARRSDFGTVDLLLADSRLASIALNEARVRLLLRTYGVSRDDANLLTFVLVVTAFRATATTVPRVARAMRRIPGMDFATGGFLVREGAVGIAGPAASEVSPFATLLTIAIAGGIAIPALRRAVRRARVVEHNVRIFREQMYSDARRRLEAALPVAPEGAATFDEGTERSAGQVV
jgi:hypothetical protein